MQGNRPRVAMLCGGYQPGYDGVSDYVRRLLASVAANVDPILVTARRHATADVPTLAPVEDWRVPDVRTVAHCLRDLQPDLVHVQYAPVAFRWQTGVCELPRLVAPLPIVVTVHEFEPNVLALLTEANAIIATTQQHAARVLESDSALQSRVSVIPIGPNVTPAAGAPAALAAESRQRFGIPPSAPLVVFFGFLHPVKGLEYLIRAIASALPDVPSVRLVLGGGWRSLALPEAEGDAYRDKLQELIDVCGLRASVCITGFLPEREVSALLYAADVVCLPFTYSLSFKSGALLAALAHGRPVIGTLCADVATPEGVIAVPPRDADALAAALSALLHDPARRQRMTAETRRQGEAYTWPAIAAQHVALYSSVL